MSTATIAAPASSTAARAVDWADVNRVARGQGLDARLWRALWFMLLPRDANRTLPTRAGIIMLLVAVGIGLAAYNNSSNILFMALSLLLSSLVLSGVMSWINFRRVRWRLVLPVRWRAAEPATVRVELSNDKKIVPTYSLVFTARARRLELKQVHYLPDRLEPGNSTAFEWIFSPQARGLETVELSGVESLFPFGFLRKTAGSGMREQVWVWPARIPYEFDPPRSREVRQPGEIQRRAGSGSDLLGLRHYRAGDPPRLVHWKATARLRELVVRQMVEEEHSGYHLVVDATRARWPDDAQFERLCSFVASLAEDLFTAGRLRTVSLPGAPTHAIKRQADLHAVFDQLARLERTEHAAPAAPVVGDVVVFQPGTRTQVHAYLGGQLAGSA